MHASTQAEHQLCDVDAQAESSKKFDELSSLNYTDFFVSAKDFVREKAQLYQALRAYESRLLKTLQSAKEEDDTKLDETAYNAELYETYSHLGHVHLLALDYARAMSAFQMAYRHGRDHFWKSPANLFGLGICFFHFRVFRPCILLFNQFIYSYPFNSKATEVHARLGFANKCIGDYALGFKHLRVALNDTRELRIFPRSLIQLHIAHCFDLFGEFQRAKEEYRLLLNYKTLPEDLYAAAYRQLGWINFRISLDKESKEDKEKLLIAAEQSIQLALKKQPQNARSLCYLGRVVSQRSQEESASVAFNNFRQAIDTDADANTWFGIGELYLQQRQPLDALQAFACAVQLDRQHVSAWASLGRLYESHRQFQHALHCYREAVQHAKKPPDWLNQRIRILDKELRVAAHLHKPPLPQTPTTPGRKSAQQPPTNQPIQLPGPDLCWSFCNIPVQVRQRRAAHRKSQELTYREGSLFWQQMNEIAAQFYREPISDFEHLDTTQRQIFTVLKLNEEALRLNELELLKQLEERLPRVYGGNSRRAGIEALEETVKPQKRPAPEARENTEDPNTHREVKSEAIPFLSQDDVDDVLGDLGNGATVRAQQQADSNANQQPQQTEFEDENEELNSSEDDVLLPPAFSLLAALKVPITVTAAELFDHCKRRKDQKLARLNRQKSNVQAVENVVEQDENCKEEKPLELFDEMPPPPRAPVPKNNGEKVDLHPRVPTIRVENSRDAHSVELQNFCYQRDIALVSGLTLALRIDLSQFSTKTLIQTDDHHEVEVRTQLKMPGDANLDNLGNKTWACYSAKSYTTIRRYGQYQAESFKHSLREEIEKLRTMPKPQPTYIRKADTGEPTAKRRKATVAAIQAEAEAAVNQIPTKIIKFGTNVDLSDEKKFNAQLKELEKMPAFCRLKSGANLLSYLGYTVLGMNTVQLYMKVPGCRTPGHLENNSFASVNVNIGPGECEWFGVPYEYYPHIDKMCRERELDFLKGAWWPDYDDLIKMKIPVYRFTQKAGDLVWVGGGCVHWVQSTGWCNNIAWNVGPTTSTQMEMALQAYEWNRLNTYRSLVPMQHLCWQLARFMRFTDQKIYNLVKAVLIRSLAYCQYTADYIQHTLKGELKYQKRQDNEEAHYCHLCEIEVFNILFVKEMNNKFRVFCLQCARRGGFDEYVFLQQTKFKELAVIFDQFQLHPVQTKSALIC